MRVSDISNWAACEAMALQSPPRPAGRTNVAAWVGTLAHAELAGIMVEERPERFAYDALTASDDQAIIQAHAIATVRPRTAGSARLGRHLETGGRGAARRTGGAPGHPRMALGPRRGHHRPQDRPECRRGVVAGGRVFAIVPIQRPVSNPDTWGGVLHVPRQGHHKDVKGSLECREAVPLMQAWGRSIDAIRCHRGRRTAHVLPRHTLRAVRDHELPSEDLDMAERMPASGRCLVAGQCIAASNTGETKTGCSGRHWTGNASHEGYAAPWKNWRRNWVGHGWRQEQWPSRTPRREAIGSLVAMALPLPKPRENNHELPEMRCRMRETGWAVRNHWP